MRLEDFMVDLQQASLQDNTSWIFQAVWVLAFIIIWIYGQRIQTTLMLKEVEGSLYKIKAMRDRGRQIAISTIKEIGNPSEDPTP
ncbi:MAG: hypothetical protein N3E47_07710, partial [Candidatus Bathyarchaeota archaeon]|nr:hypothetical protein [Candidatus Bathyarchaeota archaeon]